MNVISRFCDETCIPFYEALHRTAGDAAHILTRDDRHAGYGGRYFSVDFTRTNHAAVASAYGVKTWTVRDPYDIEEAIKAAVETDQPNLVDVISQ